MKHRTLALSTAFALIMSIVLAVAAPASEAANVTPYACISETTYSTYNKLAGFSTTGVESSEVAGPMDIQYTESDTASQTFSASAGFSFSASAVLAEATSTFQVGYSYNTSKTRSWSYTTTIPAGKVGKLRVYHRADQVGFDKFVSSPLCATTTYRNGLAVLPIADTANGTYCTFRDFKPYRPDWFQGPCSGE